MKDDRPQDSTRSLASPGSLAKQDLFQIEAHEPN